MTRELGILSAFLLLLALASIVFARGPDEVIAGSLVDEARPLVSESSADSKLSSYSISSSHPDD